MPSLSQSSGSQRKTEGRSWILRSYKRALEQAKEKNVPFEQIAEKQWGSVAKIHSLLRSVGINPDNPDSRHSHSKKEYLYSTSKHDRDLEPREFNYHKKTSEGERKSFSKSSKTFVCPGKDDVEVTMDNPTLDAGAGGWIKSVASSSLPSHQESNLDSESMNKLSQPLSLNEIPICEELITDSMINKKSAKLIKAELTGNQKKIQELKEEIENMRAKKKLQEKTEEGKSSTQGEERIALLTTTDRFGRVRPADMPESGPSYGYKPKKGKTKKIYSSNEDYSMRAVLEMERKTTAEDTHLAIAKMASKFVRSSEDDVVDDVLDQRMITNQQKEQEKEAKAIKLQSRKMEEILEKCHLCIDSSHHKEHLIVAFGMNTYLAVPSCRSLAANHCIIVPTEHTTCSLLMDENVWSEVKIFQKGLTRMFSDHNMDVIFTECFSNPNRKSHMYIDCIPLPQEEGSQAPMYFKKAILESDSEWAQNKRLIDTRKKGVRNSLPIGLPYFYVDFNNEGGFGHVIEDTTLFPHYFAKEVIGGLIDADPVLWLKPPRDNYESQKKKATQLKDMWEPYDWTKKLKE